MIVETIVTTVAPDGGELAPMGVEWGHDGSS